MYAMLDSVISRRREGGEVRSDFLQTLLRKHDAGGGDDADKLTDSQLKDNILTLLVAGHDTTTAGLTWLVKFLGENPGVLEKLREEHLGIRGRLMSDGTPPHRLRWSDVGDMPYTNKVMNETLRRATILPWFSRKAAQDFSIDGWCHATHLSITNSPLLRLAALLMDAVKKPLNAAGYDIKEGTSVNLDVVSIHHDPAVFADPERFHPDRFDVSRCRQPWLAGRRFRFDPNSLNLFTCVCERIASRCVAANPQALQLPGVRERAADVPRDEPGAPRDLRLRAPPRVPLRLEAAGGGRLGAADAGAHAQEQVPNRRNRALN
jgi:hypothetical protein